jgi:Protein of unknown function (DUF3572)
MRAPRTLGNGNDPQLIALLALGWLCGDEQRAERFLALTGLDADTLRQSIDSPATLAAILGFIAGHEPDLVACAHATGMRPEELVAAQRALAGPEEDI